MGSQGRHGKPGRAILLLWVLYFTIIHRYSTIETHASVLTSHRSGPLKAPIDTLLGEHT